MKPNPHHGLAIITQGLAAPLPGSRTGRSQGPAMTMLAVVAMAMALVSSDIPSGGSIAKPFMALPCGGRNRAPVVAWKDAPESARSFVLIVRDPDAPVPGGFYHWVLYDIPAGTRSVGGGAVAGREGIGSRGTAGYFGPCPPPGPAHHYIFTLYALDVAHVGGASALTGPQVEKDIAGRVVARATFEATAANR